MKRVLIVDDDPAIRRLMSAIVSRAGWQAVEASSGTEALGRVDEADVVVTDFCMPGMDGLELLDAIRERDATLPVILVSGYCSDSIVGWAMAGGARRCLSKPFDLQELTGAIEAALESSEVAVHAVH